MGGWVNVVGRWVVALGELEGAPDTLTEGFSGVGIEDARLQCVTDRAHRGRLRAAIGRDDARRARRGVPAGARGRKSRRLDRSRPKSPSPCPRFLLPPSLPPAPDPHAQLVLPGRFADKHIRNYRVLPNGSLADPLDKPFSVSSTEFDVTQRPWFIQRVGQQEGRNSRAGCTGSRVTTKRGEAKPQLPPRPPLTTPNE